MNIQEYEQHINGLIYRDNKLTMSQKANLRAATKQVVSLCFSAQPDAWFGVPGLHDTPYEPRR